MAFVVPGNATPADRVAWIERAIADPSTARAIAPVVRSIRSSSVGSRAIAAAALAYVQGVRFVVEAPGVDVYQTPAETIAANTGDCEDLVALFVAIARAAGVPAWPVFVAQSWAPWDHFAAAVRVEQRTEWAEPSVPGAYLGESPQNAARRLGSYGVAV